MQSLRILDKFEGGRIVSIKNTNLLFCICPYAIRYMKQNNAHCEHLKKMQISGGDRKLFQLVSEVS